jgi:CheY-like chemotaxis protein
LLLLVDDNETILETYKALLEAGGYQVTTAQRGDEAIHLAQLIHPALIMIDIQMPGMDGLAVLRQLRASRNADVATVPILALTALAMPGDRQRCLDAGADDYLSKPVAIATLMETISTLLQRRRA